MQAFKLEELRSQEAGAGSTARQLALSPEQQAALGHIFAPAVFDSSGRAAVVLGDAPAGAGALDNDAKLDAMLDALLVDPGYYEYELAAGEE